MLLCLLQSDFSHPERRRTGRVLDDGAARLNVAHAEGRMPGLLLRQHAVRFREIYDPPLPLIRNRFQNDRPENHGILRFLDFHEICIAASTSLPIAFQ
jgi:hypothetical protein